MRFSEPQSFIGSGTVSVHAPSWPGDITPCSRPSSSTSRQPASPRQSPSSRSARKLLTILNSVVRDGTLWRFRGGVVTPQLGHPSLPIWVTERRQLWLATLQLSSEGPFGS